MEAIRAKLGSLRNELSSGKITIAELQFALSQLLLSHNIRGADVISKKFDNQLELIVYTLKPADQVNAAIRVIDDVEKYLDDE